MNRTEKISKPLAWFTALMLTAFVAGCGGSSDGTPIVSPGDSVAPTVTTTAPLDAATGVALNANVTATFSELMNAATISSPGSTFTLAQSGTPVTGVVTYSGMTAVFNPTANLTATVPYTATVSTGAKDVAGNALAADKVWSFTTGAVADVVAPTVISTAPADTDTGIAINANITAAFSELMDAATVTDLSFTLAQSGTPVTGAVSYLGTSATFNPTSDLASSSVYTATVLSGASGVADLAGNSLAVDKVWSFTTAASAVAGTAPVVLGTAINYAVLAKTAVSTVPSSAVTGHVGVSPAARSTLTGWSETYDVTDTYGTSAQVVAPSRLHAADLVGGTTSSDLTTAVLNMETAYTDAAGRTATSAATTNVGSGTLTSLTLAPGVYEWGTAVTIPTDLTLNGNATDVWIFKVAGTLDMASAMNVILTGGALPKNVFWQVTGAVTIGANTHFEGVILSQTSITMGNLSTINGRLLAQTAVSLDAAAVTQPAP